LIAAAQGAPLDAIHSAFGLSIQIGAAGLQVRMQQVSRVECEAVSMRRNGLRRQVESVRAILAIGIMLAYSTIE
jgi:hypothetical protein